MYFLWIEACLGTIYGYEKWSTGSKGTFNITVPEDTDTWKITVTFDSPMDTFLAHEGSEEKCEAMICTFKNANYNGVKKAGDVLILRFNSEGINPSIISFAFNGAPCGQASETTTVVSSKVPPVSTTYGNSYGLKLNLKLT